MSRQSLGWPPNTLELPSRGISRALTDTNKTVAKSLSLGVKDSLVQTQLGL